MKERDDELHPCEQHDEELRAIREIATEARTEIAVMQKLVERLDRSLFGNGQPGVIQSIQSRVSRIEKIQYVAYGVFLAVQGLIVWGVLSVKGLIAK